MYSHGKRSKYKLEKSMHSTTQVVSFVIYIMYYKYLTVYTKQSPQPVKVVISGEMAGVYNLAFYLTYCLKFYVFNFFKSQTNN